MNKENNIIVEKVKAFCEKIKGNFDVEIFDVQFRREHPGYVLRILLDKEGLSLDDCSAFSREVSKWLDAEDLISHRYYLEVSSPGLNRPIRNIEDFKKHINKKCKVELKYKDSIGRKSYTGYIVDVKEDVISIDVRNEMVQIRYYDIKKANLEFEF
ncbi:MAG: ribosome maturation factor RimP [Deferribacterales bacterium]